MIHFLENNLFIFILFFCNVSLHLDFFLFFILVYILLFSLYFSLFFLILIKLYLFIKLHRHAFCQMNSYSLKKYLEEWWGWKIACYLSLSLSLSLGFQKRKTYYETTTNPKTTWESPPSKKIYKNHSGNLQLFIHCLFFCKNFHPYEIFFYSPLDHFIQIENSPLFLFIYVIINKSTCVEY